MQTKRVYGWMALVLFAASFPSAFAGWEQIPTSEFRLGPPPAHGSAREAADFNVLLKYQDSRSQEECRTGDAMSTPGFDSVFAGKNGILSAAQARESEELLNRVLKLTLRVSTYFKDKYHRLRPYDADSRIHPCARPPSGAKSYPSSHAAVGMVGACVLASIYSNRAAEIRAYGKHVGELRVVVGVHHPSDVQAGWELAEQICDALFKEPDFAREVRALAH